MEADILESREKRIAAFRDVCKQCGIKVTPQRIEIFLEVIGSHSHPSAEDVFEAVRKKLPTISLDTVYRTLTTLAQCGLVSKVHIIEDRTRFDPNITHHHHLVCSKCRGIADFQWSELEAAVFPPEVHAWGQPHVAHLQVRGICAKCLEKQQNLSEKAVLE